MAGTLASPFTIALQGTSPRSGAMLPSTNTLSGLITRPSTARFIASRDACSIFSSSISVWVTSPIAHDAARSRICAANATLFFSDNVFESASPVMVLSGSKTTAAAMTLPTSGPLPASSTPANGFVSILPGFVYITNRSTMLSTERGLMYKWLSISFASTYLTVPCIVYTEALESRYAFLSLIKAFNLGLSVFMGL